MLLDLRVMLTASVAAVVLLIGGFGLLAAFRTPGKPSISIPHGPAEITGSIAAGGDRSNVLTDEDRAAQPAPQIAVPKGPAPPTVRSAIIEAPEKAEAPKTAEEKPAPPKAAVAARPKPRARTGGQQEPGANFRANNPVTFPFFGFGTAAQ